MCLFDQNLKTVGIGFFVLFLAVCIFFPSSYLKAQGLKIELDYKSRYILPLEPQKEQGLSISTFPPLLRSKLRFNRKADVDYDHGYITIHDEIGSYSIYHPFSLNLHSYMEANNQSKYRQGWLNTLQSSMKKEQSERAAGLLNFEIPVKFPKLVTKIIGEGGPGLRAAGRRD
jgi:hypothetical protein